MVDCSECGSSGYAISGDLDLLDRLVMKTDARYIIIVEKVFVYFSPFYQISSGFPVSSFQAVSDTRGFVQHAIFQRLAEDRVFNHIPSILITAKGYPDIATR